MGGQGSGNFGHGGIPGHQGGSTPDKTFARGNSGKPFHPSHDTKFPGHHGDDPKGPRPLFGSEYQWRKSRGMN
jgi:hypothetical protein